MQTIVRVLETARIGISKPLLNRLTERIGEDRTVRIGFILPDLRHLRIDGNMTVRIRIVPMLILTIVILYLDSET